MGKLVVAVIVIALAVTLYYLNSDGFDPESIRNKRVLITGASTGIGEQLAYQYASLGAKIVVTARRLKELQDVAQKCKELGAIDVQCVTADMALPEDRARVMQETEKHLRGLDHLILNHGIQGRKWWTGTPENMTTLRDVMEVNFFSYVDLASMALPMLRISKGNVGVMSSIAGKAAFMAVSHYAATKFALQGFFSSLRQELHSNGTGISVTLCALGLIGTARAVDLAQEALPNWDVRPLAVPVEDTALAIVKSVTAGVSEMVYPMGANLLLHLHKVFPSLVERLLSLHND